MKWVVKYLFQSDSFAMNVASKELLLKHIVVHMQTGSRLQELMQVLPMLSKDQVQTLIKALKHQGAIFNQGTTRSALWYPTVIASQ